MIQLAGIKIDTARSVTGDHITGRVVFPFKVGGDLDADARAWREGKRITGRTMCDIDYHCRRPAGETSGTPGDGDDRPATKLRLVERYNELRRDSGGASIGKLADQVVSEARAEGVKRVSVRSLQQWARQFELSGIDGLRDRYTKPARKVLELSAERAKDSLVVCSWWAFRVGNVKRIDTPMMHAASGLLDLGYQLADVLAVIDAYYSYDCDRARFAFKPFSKWLRYDFDRWLIRAANDADYYRAKAAERAEQIHTIERPAEISIPNPRDRKRDASAPVARKAIRGLDAAIPNRAREEAATRTPRPRLADDARRLARRIGFGNLVRDDIAASAPGVTPIAAIEEASTTGEFLAGLDAPTRSTIMEAANGDAAATRAAQATLPVWWQRLPQTVRNNIDFRIDAWKRGLTPPPDAAAINNRKWFMVLPDLRRKHGLEKLGVAVRLPA